MMEFDGRPLKMIPVTCTPRKKFKTPDFFRFYFFIFYVGIMHILFFSFILL